MNSPLPRAFYTRPVLQLAPDLLGAELVHITDDGITSGLIVEVEAYQGPEDQAAHSYGGRRTERTEAMFADGGHAYVFLIYGMHFCFNVVAAGPDRPEAVLVRALEPLLGVEQMAQRRGITLDERANRWLEDRKRQLEPLQGIAVPAVSEMGRPPVSLRRLTDGPAKLCNALNVDRRHNGQDLTAGRLFLRRGASPLPSAAISTGPRINIDYAGPWVNKPWRFWVHGHPFVSGRQSDNYPHGQQQKGD